MTDVQFRLAGSYKLTGYQENELEPPHTLPDPYANLLAGGVQTATDNAYFRNRHDDEHTQNLSAQALNTIHDIRDMYQGDICVLLEDITGGIAAGVGIQDAKNAFVTAGVNGATWPGFTFAHEVSHVLGADHDEVQQLPLVGTSVSPISEIAYPDNKGYVDEAAEIKTLMAITCDECVRVPYLSNTVAQANGVSLGSSGERDNARVVAMNAATVADFSDDLPANTRIDGVTMINVDLGLAGDFEAPETPGNYWNNLTSGSKGAELDLKDVGGNATGITLNIVKPFSVIGDAHVGSLGMMNNGVDEMDPLAMGDGFTAIRWITVPKIELTGLDNGKTYGFRIFGAANLLDTEVKSEYIINRGESNEVSRVVNVAGNYYRFVDIQGISPVNNKITLTLTANHRPIFQSAWLNAFQFYVEE